MASSDANAVACEAGVALDDEGDLTRVRSVVLAELGHSKEVRRIARRQRGGLVHHVLDEALPFGDRTEHGAVIDRTDDL